MKTKRLPAVVLLVVATLSSVTIDAAERTVPTNESQESRGQLLLDKAEQDQKSSAIRPMPRFSAPPMTLKTTSGIRRLT